MGSNYREDDIVEFFNDDFSPKRIRYAVTTDCSRSPKLTAEVFKREDCPEWAKYAMVNALGHGYWYEANPSLFYVGYGHDTKVRLIGHFDSTDWPNSLIERPKKK